VWSSRRHVPRPTHTCTCASNAHAHEHHTRTDIHRHRDCRERNRTNLLLTCTRATLLPLTACDSGGIGVHRGRGACVCREPSDALRYSAHPHRCGSRHSHCHLGVGTRDGRAHARSVRVPGDRSGSWASQHCALAEHLVSALKRDARPFGLCFPSDLCVRPSAAAAGAILVPSPRTHQVHACAPFPGYLVLAAVGSRLGRMLVSHPPEHPIRPAPPSPTQPMPPSPHMHVLYKVMQARA
jgi:hypothetical protein